MKKYDVSVIVPAYNSEKFIKRCLDSLLYQTNVNLQVIVVNDGSTDNTKKICAEYEKNNENFLLLNKENEGQGLARNYGIEYAEGEYIGFVDSDDYVNQGMYSSLFEQAKKYSADWIYSYMEGESFLNLEGLDVIDNGVLIKSNYQKNIIKEQFLGGLPNEELDSFLGISVCRSIFSNKIIKENDIRFISERVVNSEDLLFNLYFLDKADIICTFNGMFYNYLHDNEFSFSVRPNDNRFNMFKKLNLKLLKMTENEEQSLRVQRRFLANLRITMVEFARWCTYSNYFETRKKMLAILNDDVVSKALNKYPINKLPFMQKVYFKLMKSKLCFFIIIFAKARYKLL